MNDELTPFENKVLRLVRHAGVWQSENTDGIQLRNTLARLEKRGLLTSELIEFGTLRAYRPVAEATHADPKQVAKLVNWPGIPADEVARLIAGRKLNTKESK